MAIAYFVNQYPKVSHSFIRREIQALEAQGVPIRRFSIRACDSELVDEADQEELDKTTVLLKNGLKGLLAPLLQVAIAHPQGLLAALKLAFQLSRTSDRNLLYHLVYIAEACALYQYTAQDGIRHIHAHFGTNSTTVALLCKALGGPSYSFTVHGPEEFDRPETLSLTEKIRQAAFVVGISSFSRSQLYRWCDRQQWDKIHVIHCGVDQQFLALSPTPVPDVPQLVCVGRLSEQKGHLLLLEAIKQLAAEGLPFKVVLVGDGPLRQEVEEAIAQYRLQNHIEITGWASGAQVQKHLQASRALVLPSFAEGLPVVIMEALALGRPVITTYVAGIPELVEPGQCGWLVPPGSTESLVKAMKDCLNTPLATLEAMGQNGRDRVLQRHNIVTEATHLANCFRRYRALPLSETPRSAPTSDVSMPSTPIV
ncbi:MULTISPECIES: glycosyltransferase [unclassified Leptolyngbya]|uniref:glycosyltransferase n=1 Tax=unclassified Leptolyngbya TaxID=2650499 RepID=UPI001684D536|nr:MULTISPECIES: glycosyltransferase [unclassified Leptolyngbya]MBD1912803.1 glycosyltransferase [Leptolyngbya sp. FACHB-8]MBD2157750.1 glycosyltransferase [Leptolyngbya sp. FACHB-16]